MAEQLGVAWDVTGGPYTAYDTVREVVAYARTGARSGVVVALPADADAAAAKLALRGYHPTNRRRVYFDGVHQAGTRPADPDTTHDQKE